jgi:hypothetical protein
VVVTGVIAAVLGGWWDRGWFWLAIAVLLLITFAMFWMTVIGIGGLALILWLMIFKPF